MLRAAILLLYIGALTAQFKKRFEFENVLSGKGTRRIPWRSGASNLASLHMFKGDIIVVNLCLSEATSVTINDLIYSNDGESDRLEVFLDNANIGIVNTEATSGGFGRFWDIFKSSGQVAVSQELFSGKHNLAISVPEGDCYGSEFDALEISLNVNVSEEQLWCGFELIYAENPTPCAVEIDSPLTTITFTPLTVFNSQSTSAQTTSEQTTSERTPLPPTTSARTTSERTTSAQTTSERTTIPPTTSERTTSERTFSAQTTSERISPAQTTSEQTTSAQKTSERTTIRLTTSDQTTSERTNLAQTTSKRISFSPTSSERISSAQTTSERTSFPSTTSELTTSAQTISERTILPPTSSERAISERTSLAQTTSDRTKLPPTSSERTSSERTTLAQTTSELTTLLPTSSERTTSERTSSAPATSERTTSFQTTLERTTLPPTPSKRTTLAQPTAERTSFPPHSSERTTSKRTTSAQTTSLQTASPQSTSERTSSPQTTLPQKTSERTSSPQTTSAQIKSASSSPQTNSLTQTTSIRISTKSLVTQSLTYTPITFSTTDVATEQTTTPNPVSCEQLSYETLCLDKTNVNIMFNPSVFRNTKIIAREVLEEIPTRQRTRGGGLVRGDKNENKDRGNRRSRRSTTGLVCDNSIWIIGVPDEDNKEFGPLSTLPNINYLVDGKKDYSTFPGTIDPRVTNEILIKYKIPRTYNIKRGKIDFTLGLVNISDSVTIGLHYYNRAKKMPSDVEFMTFHPTTLTQEWLFPARAVSPSLQNELKLVTDQSSTTPFKIDFLQLRYQKRDWPTTGALLSSTLRVRVRGRRYRHRPGKPWPEHHGMEVIVDGSSKSGRFKKIMIYKLPYSLLFTVFDNGEIFVNHETRRGRRQNMVNRNKDRISDVSGFTLGRNEHHITLLNIDTNKNEVHVTLEEGKYAKFRISYTKTETTVIVLDTNMDSGPLSFFSTYISRASAAVTDMVVDGGITLPVMDPLVNNTLGKSFTFLKNNDDNKFDVNDNIEFVFP